MTFSVRQAIAEADLEPFPFEDAAGEVQYLPHMKALTPRQGVRILVHGELEEVVNEVAPPLGTTLMDLPAHIIEALMTAWREHSGVTLPGGEPGKSASSSRSSSSTATQSRRTSRSAASKISRRR